MDRYRRIRPSQRKDEAGNLILIIKVGLRPLEFEKGKAGIAVGAQERLESVLDTLIAATKAGELDLVPISAKDIEERAGVTAKKAG